MLFQLSGRLHVSRVWTPAAINSDSALSLQVYLLAFARCALQAARLAVAPLLVFIQAEMGFDTYTKGRILSAFPAGYLLTQVCAPSLSNT